MSHNRERLDIVMVKRGLVSSREKARSEITSGRVYVNHIKAEKASTLVNSDSEVSYIADSVSFVGRGGHKLSKALDEFGIIAKDKNALDIGASTGGFTDCLLQYGAKKVFALDVGYGQLAYKLRVDPRVISMERINVRSVTKATFADIIDLVTIDVSFISLKLVLPIVADIIPDSGEIVALVKPQFEAGKGKVSRKGIVTDQKTHTEVLTALIDFCDTTSLHAANLTFSPIKGPAGNIEFLVHIVKKVKDGVYAERLFNTQTLKSKVNEIVAASHIELKS